MANRIIRGRSTGFVRGPRRATDWLSNSAETDRSTLGAATAVLDQTFAFGEPATVVRTRGTLWVASDQAAANESPFGALGFAIVTDQAAGVGVTALPTPTTEAFSDEWFVWLPWFADARFSSAVGVGFRTFYEYKFDSKAMRKVDADTTAVVVIENSSATDGCLFLLQFRMLVKLHG